MSKENSKKSKLKIILICVVFVISIIIAIYIGASIVRNRAASKIENVLGIDVSAYQGEIDWKEIESQGIYFAYIKATEGDDYLDKRFEQNWDDLDSTKIKKGAYLFFDFKADPIKMSEFFIDNVPVDKNALPPVVDIEMPDNTSELPDAKTVKKHLEVVLEKLSKNYKKDPIIYTNLNTYDQFVKNDFSDYKIWICDLSSEEPELDDHDWVFWQYTWRGILNGTNGSTRFIDLDIYNGNLQDFYNEFDSKNIFGF